MMSPHLHAEAFKLMLYRCESCGLGEPIWNCRDGVTPFIVDCRRCDGDAQHDDWKGDLYLPDYDPKPGGRYFRDGLPEEARAIMRRRFELGRGTHYEIPEEEWPEFIEESLVTKSVTPPGGGPALSLGEFQPGWPMLVVRGTDQDTLGARRQALDPETLRRR